MKIIFLIMIGLSMLHSELIKDGDIVKDTITNLEWQDNVADSQMRWEAAITYCEELTLENHDDWRLPNINELKTMVDRSQIKSVVSDVFKHINSFNYWSSTSHAKYTTISWTINLFTARLFYAAKGTSNSNVKCVRAGE